MQSCCIELWVESFFPSRSLLNNEIEWFPVQMGFVNLANIKHNALCYANTTEDCCHSDSTQFCRPVRMIHRLEKPLNIKFHTATAFLTVQYGVFTPLIHALTQAINSRIAYHNRHNVPAPKKRYHSIIYCPCLGARSLLPIRPAVPPWVSQNPRPRVRRR